MPSLAHLSILHFSYSCTFCLAFARMSKGSLLEAFYSQFSTPLCLLSSCSFFKTQVSTIIALFSRQVALCLNLSCVVSILQFEEPRRAKRSFVAFCALHLHHRTTNSCCLKACLLVYSCHRNLKRKTEDDVRLRYFSKLCVSSFMQRENLGIEVVAQPLLNSRFSLLFMFSNFLALSVVPWPLKHAE